MNQILFQTAIFFLISELFLNPLAPMASCPKVIIANDVFAKVNLTGCFERQTLALALASSTKQHWQGPLWKWTAALHKLSLWNWAHAYDMPWAELVRSPAAVHTYSISVAQKRIYWANQRAARKQILNFLGQLALGRCIDIFHLKTFLAHLNRVVLTKTGIYYPPTLKMRSYYPKNLPDKIIDAWVRDTVAGHYINPEKPTNARLSEILRHLLSFIEASRQEAGKEAIVTLICNFYKSTMGVAEGGFVNIFLFEQANNSMFMNMVNAMLRLSGLQGIPHGDLDERSSHFTGDEWLFYNEYFGKDFYRMVQHANPGVLKDWDLLRSEGSVTASIPAFEPGLIIEDTAQEIRRNELLRLSVPDIAQNLRTWLHLTKRDRFIQLETYEIGRDESWTALGTHLYTFALRPGEGYAILSHSPGGEIEIRRRSAIFRPPHEVIAPLEPWTDDVHARILEEIAHIHKFLGKNVIGQVWVFGSRANGSWVRDLDDTDLFLRLIDPDAVTASQLEALLGIFTRLARAPFFSQKAGLVSLDIYLYFSQSNGASFLYDPDTIFYGFSRHSIKGIRLMYQLPDYCSVTARSA